mgnify:CR=1 FL=1
MFLHSAWNASSSCRRIYGSGWHCLTATPNSSQKSSNLVKTQDLEALWCACFGVVRRQSLDGQSEVVNYPADTEWHHDGQQRTKTTADLDVTPWSQGAIKNYKRCALTKATPSLYPPPYGSNLPIYPPSERNDVHTVYLVVDLYGYALTFTWNAAWSNSILLQVLSLQQRPV